MYRLVLSLWKIGTNAHRSQEMASVHKWEMSDKRGRHFGPCKERTEMCLVIKRTDCGRGPVESPDDERCPDCCHTNTSLRTFVVTAGLNERAFQQTSVQYWPISRLHLQERAWKWRHCGPLKQRRIFTNTHGYECPPPSRNLYPISAYMKKFVSRVVVRIHGNRAKMFVPTSVCPLRVPVKYC